MIPSSMIRFDLQKRLPNGMQLDVQGELALGSCAALFGPSGVGKSTVLRMLAGLLPADAGQIEVDGQHWQHGRRSLPPQQRSVGMLFQDYALFPNLTVQQNIAYACREPSLVFELLALCQLDGLAQRKPGQLSGGQQQRVALARALARQPKLLLLDEPLSALDGALRRQTQDVLLQLQARFGFAMLLVSHDIGEVFRLAQQVWQMQDGQIVARGSPSELFLPAASAGRFQLPAQLLAKRQQDVVWVLSLLVGQQVVEVVVCGDEAARHQVGEILTVAAKGFSPMLLPAMQNNQ